MKRKVGWRIYQCVQCSERLLKKRETPIPKVTLRMRKEENDKNATHVIDQIQLLVVRRLVAVAIRTRTRTRTRDAATLHAGDALNEHTASVGRCDGCRGNCEQSGRVKKIEMESVETQCDDGGASLQTW